MKIDLEKCIGCQKCADYCPVGAISYVPDEKNTKKKKGVIDLEECVECGVCVQSCSFDLIKAEDRHFLITVGGRRRPFSGRKSGGRGACAWPSATP